MALRKTKKAVEPEPPKAPDNAEIVGLLTEIRDLLKQGRENAILNALMAPLNNATAIQAASSLMADARSVAQKLDKGDA